MPKLRLSVPGQVFDKQHFDSVYAVYQEKLGMESLSWSVQVSSYDTMTTRRLTLAFHNCSRISDNSDTLQKLGGDIARDFYRTLQNKNLYQQMAVQFVSEKGFILTLRHSSEYVFPIAWLDSNVSVTSATRFSSASTSATLSSGNGQ